MKHNWEYKRLGDLFHLQMGKTPPRDNELMWKNGTIPWVSIADMNNGRLINSSKEMLPLSTISSCNIPVIEPGTVLMSFKLSIGKTGIVECPLTTNEAIMAFLPKDNTSIDNNFLCYCLSCIKWKGNRAVKGMTINKKIISETYIHVPPIKIQKTISNELDEINELIAIRKEQLKELDNLAQSLFYDTFGDPITNPKGWEVKRIGDLTQVLTGATPSRDDASNFSGTIPWVKTTEVQNCDILSTEECISEDALKNTNCKLLPKNSILVAMYGQGRTRGQIARLRIEATTNQACAAILPSKNLKQSFLYEFLHVSYEPLRNLAIGCNQKNLNLKLIKDFFIIVPPLSLQQQFAAQVEAIEAQKGVLNESLKELQTLLDSRMDYWFN